MNALKTINENEEKVRVVDLEAELVATELKLARAPTHLVHRDRSCAERRGEHVAVVRGGEQRKRTGQPQ